MMGTNQRLYLFFGDVESKKGTSVGGYCWIYRLITDRDWVIDVSVCV